MTTVNSQNLYETIDLTGPKPVIGTKVVEKQITILNVDENIKAATDVPTSSSNTVVSTLIDRRLRYNEFLGQ